jgi:hypothetical protein
MGTIELKLIKRRSSKRRWFFLHFLLTAGLLFYLNQQLTGDSFFPIDYTSFASRIHSLVWNLKELFRQGVAEKLNPTLKSIALWGSRIIAANINDNQWLISCWLTLAVIIGMLVPTAIWGLFFVIKSLGNRFEKKAVALEAISDVLNPIRKKINKTYRRNLFRRWKQASWLILKLGIGLFFLQLLSANLWWWNKGVGWSSLLLFIPYAYWIYYSHLWGQKSTKAWLINQIDAYLGLKQGLVTLMETKRLDASSRFYKLLLRWLVTLIETKRFDTSPKFYKRLDDVFYRVKPTNLSQKLPYQFTRFTKRQIAIPLILIISLAGLTSGIYSRLVSTSFFSWTRGKVKYFSPSKNEPNSIEKLLKQEAESLQLLTAELQQNHAEVQKLEPVIDELNELAADLVYLAEEPLDINQIYRASNLQAKETVSTDTPAVDRQAVSWEEEPADVPIKIAKTNRGKRLNAEDTMKSSMLQDWQEASKPAESLTNISLQPSDKYYQSISAELRKTVQQLMALKLTEDDTSELTVNPSAATGREFAERASLADSSSGGLEDAGAELPVNAGGNKLRDIVADTNKKQSGPEPTKPLTTLFQKIKDSLSNFYAQSKLPKKQTKPNQDITSADRVADKKANQQAGKHKQKRDNSTKASSAEVPTIKPIASVLDQIGEKLSNITLYEEGAKKDKPVPSDEPRQLKSTAQGKLANNVRLKPIKTKTRAKTEAESADSTWPEMAINNPQYIEIDPSAKPASNRPLLKNKDNAFATNYPYGVTKPIVRKNRQGDKLGPPKHPLGLSEGGFRANGAQFLAGNKFSPPEHPAGTPVEKLKVAASCIESLANRLLKINNPAGISFNPRENQESLSSREMGKAFVKKPKQVDNSLLQVTDQIKQVDDPQQISAITSELAELTNELFAWGRNSGNKLSRLRPDVAQLTETDFLGKKVPSPLDQGGPDKANREAVIIRGKRNKASADSSKLERIRVERSPQHLPTHDITANVSAELRKMANKLKNVNVASVKANMSGRNLKDFIVEKQRTLDILNDQLARAKDFQSIDQIAGKISEASAKLGNLAIESLAKAEFLSKQQAVPQKPEFKQDATDSKLIERVNRDGNALLKLSQKIKQEGGGKSKIDISSRILKLAKGLSELELNEFQVEDNTAYLKNQLRNLSQQLQKISQNTKNSTDLKRNAYAVATLGKRLGELQNRGLDIAALVDGGDSGDVVDFKQLSRQLSDLSKKMQSVDQKSVAYQANQSLTNKSQPQKGKKLMDVMADGAERLEQIKHQLELTSNPQQIEKLGLDLLKLSQTFNKKIAEENSKLSLKAVSTKAVTSIGNQVKELSRQLRSNPADYQTISEQLRKMASKLKQRDREIMTAQLDSNQDITQLSSELFRLAQKLEEAGPAVLKLNETRSDSLKQQNKPEKRTGNQIDPDMYQQILDGATQDLLNISQELAKLSADSVDPIQAQATGDKAISEYTDRLGSMLEKRAITPRGLNRWAGSWPKYPRG